MNSVQQPYTMMYGCFVVMGRSPEKLRKTVGILFRTLRHPFSKTMWAALQRARILHFLAEHHYAIIKIEQSGMILSEEAIRWNY